MGLNTVERIDERIKPENTVFGNLFFVIDLHWLISKGGLSRINCSASTYVRKGIKLFNDGV